MTFLHVVHVPHLVCVYVTHPQAKITMVCKKKKKKKKKCLGVCLNVVALQGVSVCVYVDV